MSALVALKRRFADARARYPWLDRTVRMQEHYGATNSSQFAGAVTYFGFLSVFPILALAFFVIGWISKVYPNAEGNLVSALDSVLPGLVGGGPGQISLATFRNSAGAVGVLGLLGVLYAGLSWISSLQSALVVAFDVPADEKPNFIVGKLRDLVTMAVLGLVLFGSVAVTGAVRALSDRLLDWLGLGVGAGWVLWALALVVGLAADALLFYAMFRLLARPDVARRYLWQGAFLGAVGFEILKELSVYLLGAAKGQPAFQVFGISLILLVWINYFSRVTLYAAAWAYVGEKPADRSAATAVALPRIAAVEMRESVEPGTTRAFGTGVALTLAAVLGWKALGRRP